MKKWILLGAVGLFSMGCACDKGTEAPWIVDRFDDIKVVRYEVPGFENLPLNEKLMIYYLAEASVSGRDIIFDQNFRFNLPIRRTLEGIYITYQGDKTTAEWAAFEKYLKKVWFADGIHHHYSGDKFVPEFSAEYFDSLLLGTPDEALPLDFAPRTELVAAIKPVIFDPSLFPTKVNQADGVDLLATSAMNYYEGVTQAEATAFYDDMAKADAGNPQPISYGLNSKLVKKDGNLVELVWKQGGMYGKAISQIVYWLEKAREVAPDVQKQQLEHLITYYKSGDLREFDAFNIAWTKDTESTVDFVNGFTEVYGDPLGTKASWEAVTNFVDAEATKRAQIISDNAQWFEDNSPIDPAYKKAKVKGVSAKVITAAMLGGDCYPTPPIGINLPNADWIRRDFGSKSVTIENLTYAYDKSSEGSGMKEEFVLRKEDRERMSKYGSLGGNLHTDLHECLGHGSGQLAPGVTGNELRQYSSVLEESRADLFALYYVADPKMVELGLIPSMDVAKAEFASYMMNGLMTQLARIEPDKNIEEAHMRNRAAVAGWCYEHGKANNVVEKVVKDGKTYIVVNDFEALRGLVGELLTEVQRIKSEGDFEACREFIETYGVRVDPVIHKEVLERYNALNIAPYGGFVNPRYELVTNENTGEITDVKVVYGEGYVDQMLRYSRDYSFLPSRNE